MDDLYHIIGALPDAHAQIDYSCSLLTFSKRNSVVMATSLQPASARTKMFLFHCSVAIIYEDHKFIIWTYYHFLWHSVMS